MPPADPRDGTAEFRRRKADLLAGLSGDVLEIGAGSGANFGFYGRDVRWTGLEPNRRLQKKLSAEARAHGHDAPVLVAGAERIPLPDASMSAVVSTVVLCSVGDQDAVLAEIVRVLRPGGRFLFFEHVAAEPRTWSRRAQRAVSPFTRLFDRGCDPARETWRSIERAGFDRVELDWFVSLAPFGIRIPLIAGTGTV